MLVIISGCGGAGKTSVIKGLTIRNPDYEVLKTFNSRPPRNEEDKLYYDFVSEEEFKDKIRNKEMIEWVKIFDFYKGLSKTSFNQAICSDKIYIKDIDIIGTEKILGLIKDKSKVLTIFLDVPKEILIKRLIDRADTDVEKKAERFDYEISFADKYDYRIESLDTKYSVSNAENIIKKYFNLK